MSDPRPPLAPRTILVYVGLDRVGDSLLKLPFVRGLRQAFPEAHITWVAGKDTSVYATVMAPVVRGLIDEVIERAGIGLDPLELLRRPLGGRRFDLVIDSQRVALASLALLRIPCRWRISPFARFLFSTVKPAKTYRFPKTMLRQMLDLLELASGQSFPSPAFIALPIDEAQDKDAAGLLPPGPLYIGIAPGAGGLPKCWPLERFAQLANAQRDKGRVPVFLLGPAEIDWQTKLEALAQGALFPLQAPGVRERHGFSPLFTVALGRRLAAAIANDSGVGHMLAATGRPLVSLFGPTSPAKFTPMTDRLVLVTAQSFGGREMERIPLHAALEALETALQSDAPAA
ncbi:MAG: glycosyltransferase family 9 protein [Rhodospirillales bacterium]|nr:glycosyltransferase family 9 protein [Rhodospirillales bacterium]